MANDGWANPHLLVETDWLADHLGDPDLAVVDCDLLPAYQRLHLPGAVWSLSRYWKEGGTDSAVHGISDPDEFAALMGRLGINSDSRVLAYDGSGGLYAARFWWTCRRFGFHGVQVLHGGLDKWYAEDRPLSRDNVRPHPTTFTAAPSDDSLLCRLGDVAHDCEDPGHIFWDTRSDAEWTGANTRGTQRGGRIPHAVHIEWLDTLQQPVRTLKPPAELRRLLAQAGITPDKTVTTY